MKKYPKIKHTVSKVKENKFERCFEPVPETFRGKPTGNKVLNDGCKFCSYRFDCWDSLTELPAVKSQAKNPPTVAYVELAKEYKWMMNSNELAEQIKEAERILQNFARNIVNVRLQVYVQLFSA